MTPKTFCIGVGLFALVLALYLLVIFPALAWPEDANPLPEQSDFSPAPTLEQ